MNALAQFVRVRNRLALVAAVLACACGNDAPEVTRFCDVVPCTPECAALQVHPCLVENAECQDVVRKAVECVRGVRFERRPNVRIRRERGVDASVPVLDAGVDTDVSDASALDAAVLASDAGAVDGGVAPWRSAPLSVDHRFLPHELDVKDYHATRALQALGLVAPDIDLAGAWEQASKRVIGTYTAMDQTLEVLLSEERQPWFEMGTLAHEMIHGLQDQEMDLPRWREKQAAKGASNQAVRAFIEGEAELYQLLVMHFMLGISYSDERIEELIRKSTKSLMHSIDESASPLAVSQLGIVYPVGAKLHLRRWKRYRVQGVKRLANAFPRDLAAWMRADDFSTRLEMSCADVEPEMDTELRGVWRFTGGAEYLLPLLIKRMRHMGELAYPLAWEASTAWRGDCFEIWGEAFEPAAPVPKEERLLTGYSPVDADAGSTASQSGGVDGGDAGGLPTFPPLARRADVRVKWTIALADAEIARKVNELLLLSAWPETWPGVEIDSRQEGNRIIFELMTEQLPALDEPLLDCWPLYPFDPNEIYLMSPGRGIAHWSQPEHALGSVGDSLDSSQLMPDGELLLRGRYVFTPDWCHYPDEPYPDVRDAAQNDPQLPLPCAPHAGVAVVGATGRTLYQCDGQSAWKDADGNDVLPADLGRLQAVGYEDTALLSEGVYSFEEAATGAALGEASDAGRTNGLRADTGSVDASVVDASAGTEVVDASTNSLQAQLGTLRDFEGLPREAIEAVRAVPDGYWLVMRRGLRPTTYSLWHVDFRGHAELIVEHDPVPPSYLPTSTSVDGYGTIFVVVTRDAESSLWRLHVDGTVEMSDAAGRLVTGP